MKLSIIKNKTSNDDGYIVKIVNNGVEEDFDYVKLIDYLYHNKDTNIEIEFSEDIENSDKNEVLNLFDKIKKEITSEKSTTNSEKTNL